MIVIFSHKQKLVQTESKNKFTIEPAAYVCKHVAKIRRIFHFASITIE